MELFNTFKGNSKNSETLTKEFPFDNTPNTATMVCSHILDKGEPILFALRDKNDGMWQFFCEREHTLDDIRLVALQEVFELDGSISSLATMPYGFCATRVSAKSNWNINEC